MRSKASQQPTEEEEEEEESEELRYCKMELYAAFKDNTPLDNFLYAFLELDEENFSGRTAYTETTKGYYLDLLSTALDMGLPTLMTPQGFCHKKYKKKEAHCIRIIAEAGCEANDEGFICMEKLYLHWKKKEKISKKPVPGTKRLSNEALIEAISRGSDNVESLTDGYLLDEYYNEHGSRTHYYFRDLEDDELRDAYFRDFMQYRQHQRDLYHARQNKYGIGDVSYANVCLEYYRRQNVSKQFDNYYAMYLHDTIKNIGSNRFRSRKEYCEKFLSELESD